MPIGIKITIPPTSEPVLVPEMRDYLRVDATESDVLIGGLITAARRHCEVYTRRQFMQATIRLTMDWFPGRFRANLDAFRRERVWEHGRFYQGSSILLPYPPFQSVTSIAYVDASGATQTMDLSTVKIDTDAEPGRVNPVYGTDWPDARDEINAVQVTYVAGWATAAEVPANIKLAIKLLVGHWYDNRVAVGSSGMKEMPMAVCPLLIDSVIPTIY